MIKVSVMYPYAPEARFDHDYYRDIHMPMVQDCLGNACKYYSVDRGLVGAAPDAPPTYIAACHIFSNSIEEFQAAFEPCITRILGDVPNYTDLAPVIQISEVVVG